MLKALAAFDHARGFRQWIDAGRHVRKGERAFNILAPCTKKIRTTEDETGHQVEGIAVVGFRSIPMFGYPQTHGEPLSDRAESDAFIDVLAVVDVARHWGLSVSTFNGKGARCQDYYRDGQAIALGVENLCTWCHEMLHASDDRLGNLADSSKQFREVVAELGSAVLLACLGMERDADYGGCWQYVSG